MLIMNPLLSQLLGNQAKLLDHTISNSLNIDELNQPSPGTGSSPGAWTTITNFWCPGITELSESLDRPIIRTGLDGVPDENARPGSPSSHGAGFDNADIKASKPASALSINGKKIEQPPEYKMSVVNDSGVYLPPSPPEKKSFWPRRSNPSNASSSTTRSFAEIEPFSISRESFDS
ncbi:hypothetical protein O988_02470, partial [Pseudogymnoascus sp. VKM F-3808]